LSHEGRTVGRGYFLPTGEPAEEEGFDFATVLWRDVRESIESERERIQAQAVRRKRRERRS
jgi:hypothetical protein